MKTWFFVQRCDVMQEEFIAVPEALYDKVIERNVGQPRFIAESWCAPRAAAPGLPVVTGTFRKPGGDTVWAQVARRSVGVLCAFDALRDGGSVDSADVILCAYGCDKVERSLAFEMAGVPEPMRDENGELPKWTRNGHRTIRYFQFDAHANNYVEFDASRVEVVSPYAISISRDLIAASGGEEMLPGIIANCLKLGRVPGVVTLAGRIYNTHTMQEMRQRAERPNETISIAPVNEVYGEGPGSRYLKTAQKLTSEAVEKLREGFRRCAERPVKPAYDSDLLDMETTARNITLASRKAKYDARHPPKPAEPKPLPPAPDDPLKVFIRRRFIP